ncbi:GNAT family N-acetyltransferase [Streptomyces albogriseolus]
MRLPRTGRGGRLGARQVQPRRHRGPHRGARLPGRAACRRARGVATAAVRDICRLAVSEYGLRALRAATVHRNIASQRVLVKAGFVPVGPVDPAHVGGETGTWYQRDLVDAVSP